MDLAQFPRLRLTALPTPLEPLERLSGALGGPRLFIKRDDMTGLATGGNKTRKLEFALADAREKGANHIITAGGFQSNHARQTAAASAHLGLGCDLVLTHNAPTQSEDYKSSGNIFLDKILGATLHLHPAGSDREQLMAERAAALTAQGQIPYVLPIGASYPIGNLGYVNAAKEILGQARDRGLSLDAVVLATSSGGTMAGLAAGFDCLGAEIEVIGVDIDENPLCLEAVVMPQIGATKALLGHEPELRHARVEALLGHAEGGYGHSGENMVRSLAKLARLEGLLLDPVYSAKAMSGFISLVESRRFTTKQNLLFLHSGGAAGLFGYRETFKLPD